MPLTDIDGRRLGDSVADKLGNRNLIINGAMLVAQRATSSTTSGYGTVDRFTHEHGGTDEAPTFAQVDVSSSDTPYSLGFKKALKATNGNQTSGAGAADYVGIGHRIEAQNLANSGWNFTSSSSYITLTFWARSSVAKSFKGYFKTYDGTAQIYPFNTGTLSANTWTKVTKTIPGNSNITINNDNGLGLELFVYQFLGTDYTDSSVTENAWAAYASGTRTPDDDSSWYTTNDATFEITGVQLEIGNTATPFEHRIFSDELFRCQRYYQEIVCGRTNTSYSGFSDDNGRVLITMPLPREPRLNIGHDISGSTLTRTGVIRVRTGFPSSSANNVDAIDYYGNFSSGITIGLSTTDSSVTANNAYLVRMGSGNNEVMFTLDTEL